MSQHSFKFHFRGSDFYPSVKPVINNVYKVHFYKSLVEFGLPQYFTFNIDTLEVIMDDSVQQLNPDKLFLTVFKDSLTEHLSGIQQTHQHS